MPYIGNIVQDFSVSTAMLNTDSVTSVKVLDGTIVNADINASAAIDGTKISPDFGSQNVTSTGYFTFGTAGGTDNFSKSNLRIENTYPTLFLNDTDTNNDFYLRNADGVFGIHDVQANVNRLTINSSGTAAFSGNLDVGAGLDVTGAITGTTSLTLGNTSLSSQYLINTTGDLYIRDTDGNIFIEAKTDQYSIRCVADGQVILHHSGNQRLQTTTDGITVDKGITVNGAEAGDAQIRLRADEGDDNNDTYRLLVADGGDGLKIQNFDGSFNDRLEVNSTGAKVTGSLGIGTSPTRNFHVNSGEINEAARFESTDTEVTVEFKDTTGTASLKCRNDYRFNDDASELMRVTSTGVSIGTTVRNEKLNIHTASSLKAQMQFTNTTTGTAAGDGLIIGITGGEEAIIWNQENTKLTFATNNTARLTIDSSGNLGLHNVSPQGELHIGKSDNTNHEAIIILNNGGATGNEAGIEWRYESNTTPRAKIHLDSSSQDLNFSTADSIAITIDSSGNVGIGTTSPSETLDVEGTIECLNELRSKTGNDLKLNAGSANRDIFLQVNDSTLMTVQGSTERVGIGTTSPAQTLDVNGTGIIRGNTQVLGTITTSINGDQTTQGGASLVMTHLTNTNLRANHFIVDDFPSGGGTYFIQATESGVSNERHICMQGYGGKVKIGGQGTAPEEKLDVEGNIKLRGGDLKISHGRGIDFSLNTENESGAGSSSGQLLDDYEEGTWTPEFDAPNQSSTTFAHNHQKGYYTKIGNLVHVTCYLQGYADTNTSGGSNDNIVILGLPFTVADLPGGGNTRHAASMAVGSRYRLLVDDLIIHAFGSHDYAMLFEATSGNVMTGVKSNQMTARGGTNEVYFAGSYRVHA